MNNEQIYGENLKHPSGLCKDQAVESFFVGDEDVWMELLETLENDSINGNLKSIHQKIKERNQKDLRSALHKMKSPVA